MRNIEGYYDAGHGLGWFASRKEAIQALDSFLSAEIQAVEVQPLLNRLQQFANSHGNFSFKIGSGVRF